MGVIIIVLMIVIAYMWREYYKIDDAIKELRRELRRKQE